MDAAAPAKKPARLDLIGRRILRSLADHVEVDTAAMARRLGASEEVVRVRLQAMRESGIVQGFRLRLDTRQLGQSFEFLVTGVPSERTDRDALAGLCSDPQVTRVLGLASTHSVAFTVIGDDLAATRSHGLALATRAGLRQPHAALVVTTFEDRSGGLPPAMLVSAPGETAVATAPATPAAIQVETAVEA